MANGMDRRRLIIAAGGTVAGAGASLPATALPATNGAAATARSIEALRAISVISDLCVDTLGYHAPGDGGGNRFYGATGAIRGTYIDDGATVIVPLGGDGSSAWVVVDSLAINLRQFGAKGDGGNDDTATIQAAIAHALKSGGHVYCPEGNYVITRTVVIGRTDLKRQNGFLLLGAGAWRTQFTWNGPAGGIVLHMPAILHGVVERFRILGGTARPGVGLLIDGGKRSSGGHNTLCNVAIGNCEIGLKIGGKPGTGVDSVPSNVFVGFSIVNCTSACVRIEGNGTDGQTFINLATANTPVVIDGYYARSVSVYGGVHSNNTGAGQNYPNFIYMNLDGVLGNGGYTLDTLRLEGGVTLLSVSVPNSNDAWNQILPFSARNVHNVSVPVDIAVPYNIIRCDSTAQIVLENCSFPAQQGRFYFGNVARTNRYANLELINCVLSDEVTPSMFGSLFYVTGNGQSAGPGGGLRARMRGCIKVASSTDLLPPNSTARFKDGTYIVTPKTADARSPFIEYEESAARAYAGSAAPVGGTWQVGDKVYSSTPLAGDYIGWVCVSAGSPGVWKGFGAIAG